MAAWHASPCWFSPGWPCWATLNSRVWQERSAVDIVEDVFADHASIAAWRWDDDVAQHVANGLNGPTGGVRKYCVQYRESDPGLCPTHPGRRRPELARGRRHRRPGGHTMVILPTA